MLCNHVGPQRATESKVRTTTALCGGMVPQHPHLAVQLALVLEGVANNNARYEPWKGVRNLLAHQLEH